MRSILTLDQFDKKTISLLFNRVKKIKQTSFNKLSKILKNKIITLLFFEPSSRTFGSFCSAVKRLGGQTIEYQDPLATSSAVKGETLEDTIKMFANYSDLIVIRHPEIGAARRAAEASSVPVINAGDGAGEHPTQALLDLYTIEEKFKKLNHLTGLIAGDLLYGRTVHSLLKGLSIYSNNTVYLLSPKELRLPKNLLNKFYNRGLKLIEINEGKDIPGNCHFWYWTRVQKERFKKIADYEKVKNKLVVTHELLKNKGNKNMIIMHPLPRVGEIETVIDSDPRALYLTKQSQNGLYVRMALLSLILK
jgi:aspartate carbamoyltransferase